MTYLTHTLGGIAAGYGLVATAGISDEIAIAVVIGGATVGALLPDIDHNNSAISNSSIATEAVSKIVTAFFNHRGVIHTPVFIGLTFILFKIICAIAVNSQYLGIANWVILALCTGMFSHLTLDTLNPGGIMWLWPMSKRKLNIASIKTSSLAEKTFCVLLGIGLCYIYSKSVGIDEQITKLLKGVGHNF